MQVRTFLGILLGVVAAILVAVLTNLNRELLVGSFRLTSELDIRLWVAVLGVFLAGLLPPGTVLLVSSLRHDLRARRARRRSREAESLEQRQRRAIDFHVDSQWSKAAAELEVVLTERPDDFAALFFYGEVLRHQGAAAEALDVHRRAAVLYPRSTALLYQLIEDHEALGEAEVAREIRNRVLREFPGRGLAIMRRRRQRALAERDWDEALAWHEKTEEILGGEEVRGERAHEAGVSLGLTYQRAVRLLEKDRVEEATQIFRLLLEREPRFIPAGIMLGEAELLRDHEDVAVEEWKRGFLETGSPVFLLRIEDHFIEAAEPARAIEALRYLINHSENDVLVRFFLGRLYDRLEMHEEAFAMLESLAERLDASPSYHYLLGRLHQRRGDLRTAVASYLASLRRLGLPTTSWVCRSCRAQHADWQDRCPICGAWNSVDFDVEVEQLSEEELGVAARPVWGGYDELQDESQVDDIPAEP